ncbi:MAG: hypothetical protein D6741_09220 [Planctomycetota bacterium]|nr:MAG: hypothetical protein D6741_09220 [Planctomycetota bacterium]
MKESRMTLELKSFVQAGVGWQWRDATTAGSTADSGTMPFRLNFAAGSDPGCADLVWRQFGRSLADGQSDVWDLTDLPFSVFESELRFAFSSVRAMLLVNRGESTGEIYLSGSEPAPWLGPLADPSQTLAVAPGSPLLWAHANDGWAVEAPHHLLRVEAYGGDATYDLVLLGVRA